ncbi:manganese transport protein [Gracilaria domingensis]|nr:manganese transport protein [Gracilaria domingensis]
MNHKGKVTRKCDACSSPRQHGYGPGVLEVIHSSWGFRESYHWNDCKRELKRKNDLTKHKQLICPDQEIPPLRTARLQFRTVLSSGAKRLKRGATEGHRAPKPAPKMFRSRMSSRQLSISSTATRSVKGADRGSSNFNLRVSTEPLSNEAAPSRLPHSSVPQPFGSVERHCPEQARQVARRQIDLNGEVEGALPVCDGTFIVVDVVDGVCLQTVTLLRAALKHEVRPKLVLNKINRLFVELDLDPREAFEHILGTLAGVNDRMGMRQVVKMMAAASELESEA